MDSYIGFMQSTVFDETSLHEKFIDRTWSDEEKFELYNDDFEGKNRAETWITQWNEQLKNYFYGGILIGWHSFVEDQFKRIGNALGVEYKEKGYIGKYKIAQHYWNEYKTISKLRNKIVHKDRGALRYRTHIRPENIKGYYKTNIKEFGVGSTVWIQLDITKNDNNKFDKATCYYAVKNQILRFIKHDLYIAPTHEYSKHLINLGNSIFTQIQNDLYRMEKTSGISV
ncbi:MAG: hypothetical protein M1485_00975 [Chloroflexi bacterium]|nr:hypothetical protein [Chloroflexota bacterium]